MYFTEGQLRKYERIMQEKPEFDRKNIITKTVEERDCKHCLYFIKHHSKCSKKKCVLFEE